MTDRQRIVQVSDLHLSRKRAYHQDNWEIVLDWLAAERPDLVVVSGDVALSDPDAVDDLVFAREQVERIPVPWLAIPGNHDIGDNVLSGGMKQRVDAERRRRWLDLFGPDYWRKDLGAWTLIGVNAQILNADGLEAEVEQAAWLEATVGDLPPERPIALFVHKPLFVDRPSETTVSGDCLELEARRRLLAPFTGRSLRLVACGHKHQYRSFGLDGTIHLWAPATGMVNFGPDRTMWGLRVVGFVEITLAGERMRQRLVGHDFLFRHESYVHIGEHRSLMAGPERPA